MSDLDELAAANQQRLYVPVRRPEPPPPLPIGSSDRPTIVYVTQAAAPRQPAARRASPFTAGFFGTLGVIAALVVVAVVCRAIESASEAAAEAARNHREVERKQATEPRLPQVAEQGQAPPAMMPARSSRGYFSQDVDTWVEVVGEDHVRVHGRNMTGQRYANVRLLVWGDSKVMPVLEVTLPRVDGNQTFDRTFTVAELAKRLAGKAPTISVASPH
jgi:hypothetical protein